MHWTGRNATSKKKEKMIEEHQCRDQKHEEMESDSEQDDEDERDWKEKFSQLRKTQEQLEDCSIEMDAKLRENKKHMKKE